MIESMIESNESLPSITRRFEQDLFIFLNRFSIKFCDTAFCDRKAVEKNKQILNKCKSF
jgi:hypothetical protein